LFSKYAKLLSTHKGKQRIVAVALRKGRVLAIGYNSYSKTHPRQASFARGVGQDERVYLHAEISALLRCRVKPDELHIVRIKRDGGYGCASPCPVCRLAISTVNPRMKVVHT
jgi:deoxycytidylate deaminase